MKTLREKLAAAVVETHTHPELTARLRAILQQLDQADEEAVLDGYCSNCGQWDVSWCCSDPRED